jgi:hypothetical protein
VAERVNEERDAGQAQQQYSYQQVTEHDDPMKARLVN